MSISSPELARIGSVLHRAATSAASQHRAARRKHRQIAALAAVAILAATGAALASVPDLASMLPGYSTATTPAVSANDVSAALTPPDGAATPRLGPSATVLNDLTSFGVDLMQLHRATSTRLGVSVVIAPSTRGSGRVCVLYIQQGTTTTQCGSEADLESGGRISAPDGSPIYVGLRPDGVSRVTATDGTSVPVVDNVYISDKPIVGSPLG